MLQDTQEGDAGPGRGCIAGEAALRIAKPESTACYYMPEVCCCSLWPRGRGGTGLYHADINLRYALKYLNQWLDAQWLCIQNALAAHTLGRVVQDDVYVTEVLRGTYYWGRYSPGERH